MPVADRTAHRKYGIDGPRVPRIDMRRIVSEERIKVDYCGTPSTGCDGAASGRALSRREVGRLALEVDHGLDGFCAALLNRIGPGQLAQFFGRPGPGRGIRSIITALDPSLADCSGMALHLEMLLQPTTSRESIPADATPILVSTRRSSRISGAIYYLGDCYFCPRAEAGGCRRGFSL